MEMIIQIKDGTTEWDLVVTKRKDKYYICDTTDSDLCASGDTIDEALENFFEGEALFI